MRCRVGVVVTVWWCGLLLGLARAAAPAQAESPAGEEVEVVAEEVPVTASARSLDRAAIEALPGRSADDFLRAMPGLHLSQHGGRGKAYQFYLRGFDAVDGGDLAVSLEGVPLNEVSNIHAHGYLDLQLIPTVLVSGLDLWPGTARPEAGDFAVAGSADFGLGLAGPGGQVAMMVGTDRSVRGTAAWRPRGSQPSSFVVAEAEVGGGIGDARGWQQARAGVGHVFKLGGARLRVWALGYHGAFASPGVLREDDLQAGELGFYAAYPGSGGGTSSRVLGAAQAWGGRSDLVWRASVYGGWRQLALQQNFTGWFNDPTRGDGTRQHHRALTAGTQAQLAWTPSRRVGLRAGISARVDGLKQREDAVLPEGQVWLAAEPVAATQASAGVWAAVPLRPLPWLRVEPGLRAQAFVVDRGDDGAGWAPALAPKLSLALGGDAPVTGFFSYGRGFRSPDARGVSAGERPPVAVVDGVELGMRAQPVRWMSARLAGFVSVVSDEIVFDHVTASFLPTGATRRVGLDGGVAFIPVDALHIDVDLTWSDGRYTALGDPIPYAPRILGNVAVYVEGLQLGGARLTAGLRTWMLGPRPLTDGFLSRPAVVTELTSQLDLGEWAVSLAVDNAFASQWRDGEYLYPSQWDPEGPLSELPARHITAGAPFALRLGTTRRF